MTIFPYTEDLLFTYSNRMLINLLLFYVISAVLFYNELDTVGNLMNVEKNNYCFLLG